MIELRTRWEPRDWELLNLATNKFFASPLSVIGFSFVALHITFNGSSLSFDASRHSASESQWLMHDEGESRARRWIIVSFRFYSIVSFSAEEKEDFPLNEAAKGSEWKIRRT